MVRIHSTVLQASLSSNTIPAEGGHEAAPQPQETQHWMEVKRINVFFLDFWLLKRASGANLGALCPRSALGPIVVPKRASQCHVWLLTKLI